MGGRRVPEIKHTVKITLNECYPRTVNEVSMNWGADEIAKLQVEMIYYDFTEKFDLGEPADSNGTSLAGMIRKGMNMFNAIKPLVGGIARGGAGGLLTGVKGSLGNIGTNLKVF